MNRWVPPELVVGDTCRLFTDTCLYHNVTITEVNRYCDGERYAFTLYRVSASHISLSERSWHRSDLFKLDETEHLIREIDEKIQSLEYLKTELQDEE